MGINYFKLAEKDFHINLLKAWKLILHLGKVKEKDFSIQ